MRQLCLLVLDNLLKLKSQALGDRIDTEVKKFGSGFRATLSNSLAPDLIYYSHRPIAPIGSPTTGQFTPPNPRC